MSAGTPTPAITRVLDAKREIPFCLIMIAANAKLMALQITRYGVRHEDFASLAVDAHRTAVKNPMVLFRKPVDNEMAYRSQVISPPLCLFDCAPMCDGAAAVVLCPADEARAFHEIPTRNMGSGCATDRLVLEDRVDPLSLEAGRMCASLCCRNAGIQPEDTDFFEAHDAFSIITCLQLEAVGFAKPGEGWRLAAEGETFREGGLPMSTMGGLKVRGHPIGSMALYQIAEIVLQMQEKQVAINLGERMSQ
jgi:acetyl-CoA C-acetyltransferase